MMHEILADETAATATAAALVIVIAACCCYKQINFRLWRNRNDRRYLTVLFCIGTDKVCIVSTLGVDELK